MHRLYEPEDWGHCCKIESPRNIRSSTHKFSTTRPPKYKLIKKETSNHAKLPGRKDNEALTKNCRKLSRDGSMRGDSSQEAAYQLVVQCQIVSPAGIHISMGLNRSYLGIYMCMQVDMHAITIDEKKEEMNLRESGDMYIEWFGGWRQKGEKKK